MMASQQRMSEPELTISDMLSLCHAMPCPRIVLTPANLVAFVKSLVCGVGSQVYLLMR